MIDAGDNIFLVDVREPNEYEIVSIPGATLIPKGEFLSGAALEKLPQDKRIVLHCKSGARSAEALAVVKNAGSPTRCTSVAGCWPGSTRSTRHFRPISTERAGYLARPAGLRSAREVAREG